MGFSGDKMGPKTMMSKFMAVFFPTICVLMIIIVNSFSTSIGNLEEELIRDREMADINYISDMLDEGNWSLVGTSLYKGDKLIGDGTRANAWLEPFYRHENKTETNGYVFARCSDKNLKWVGDKGTGYQQGHYIRVAGSTKDADGTSLVGTYIDKKVADELDKNGVFSGPANVNGVYYYCLYKTLKDRDGIVVGAIVVGRNVSALDKQENEFMSTALVTIVTLLFFVTLLLMFIVVLWNDNIDRIKNYLRAIGSGEFPSEPLVLNSQDELGLMAKSVNEMTAALKEKERIGAELNVATDIQANMLPSIFPAFPERSDLDIYATMNPAKEVGGDFYDFFAIDERHYAVVIADVSGKGVPAALFMVIAKTLIKNFAQTGLEPKDIFERTNTTLCESNEAGLFVTAWMAVIDTERNVITCVNAGHNPPLFKKKGGEFEYLEIKHGFVLAGLESVKYQQTEIEMNPGDRLYLYTDGVTEATSEQLELYGEERLKNYLNAHANDSIRDILHGVRSDIDRFVGKAEQFDDITMLLFDYKELQEQKQQEA